MKWETLYQQISLGIDRATSLHAVSLCSDPAPGNVLLGHVSGKVQTIRDVLPECTANTKTERVVIASCSPGDEEMKLIASMRGVWLLCCYDPAAPTLLRPDQRVTSDHGGTSALARIPLLHVAVPLALRGPRAHRRRSVVCCWLVSRLQTLHRFSC